ncbi:FtsQ-type POTRA domain-containing protein [Microbacterium azadirachtae]|uniref:Cell division protein FtsQ n=1 Tax=Microbacterium azadirachtae TaxID=582680 RepID=A0A0F0LHA3_9MICO|nr:FtsQ-type POTRA domain-containing protein [Microbacterium azadirachtae]KJL32612.1 Cell division protein FtsQ [Microbacterium azadirachtae]
MRRPSAIPSPAPPVEPERPAGAQPFDGARRRATGFGIDASAGPEMDAIPAVPDDADTTAPILLDRGASAVSSTARERAEEADPTAAQDDVPLTARDLWHATRARRKALRTEIRRFTQRSRRRRIGWIVGAALALLVVGGSIGAAYSPLFAVETVTVEGTSALKAADVQKALSGQVGRPLALVDSSAVKAALVAFPLIETYRLEAHPPHDLVVRIVERTPVGVLQADDGRFTVVDAAGVALSTAEARPAGYALIDVAGGTGSKAFAAVGTALRSLPAELRGQVDSATASTPDDIVLKLSGGAQVVWGSAEQSARKTLSLQALMKANPSAASYDVSSPGVGIVG